MLLNVNNLQAGQLICASDDGKSLVNKSIELFDIKDKRFADIPDGCIYMKRGDAFVALDLSSYVNELIELRLQSVNDVLSKTLVVTCVD